MTAASPATRCVLRYCRAGFETECSRELPDAITASNAIVGVESEPASGFAATWLRDPIDAAASPALFDWRRSIFARQSLPVFARIDGLPRTDRLTQIVAALAAR